MGLAAPFSFRPRVIARLFRLTARLVGNYGINRQIAKFFVLKAQPADGFPSGEPGWQLSAAASGRWLVLVFAISLTHVRSFGFTAERSKRSNCINVPENAFYPGHGSNGPRHEVMKGSVSGTGVSQRWRGLGRRTRVDGNGNLSSSRIGRVDRRNLKSKCYQGRGKGDESTPRKRMHESEWVRI